MNEQINRQVEESVLASLAELAALEEQRAYLAAPFERSMADMKSQLASATASIDYAIEQARAGIREGVLGLGHSIKGEKLHAVYNGGKMSWDSKGLGGYAVAHPEVLQFRTVGEPWVTFRGVTPSTPKGN